MNVSCPECRSVFRLDPAKITSVSMRARCSVCGGLIPVGAAVSWGDELPVIPAPTLASGASAPGVRPITTGARTPAPHAATSWPPPIPRAEPPKRAPATPPAPGSTPATPNQQPAPVRHRTPPFSPKFTPSMAKEERLPDEKLRQAPPPLTSAPPAPSVAAASRPEPVIPSTLDSMFGAPLTPPSRAAVPDASPPRPPSPSPLSTTGSLSAAFSTPSTPAPPLAAVQRKPINPFLANDPNQKARRLARALVSDMVAYHPTKREEGIQAGTLKHLFRDEIKKSYEEYVEQVGREFAESTVHFQEALNDVLAAGRKVF